MVANANSGVLVVSVDLELELGQRDVKQHRRFRSTAVDLIKMFRRYQVPATWAVSDPIRSIATKAILAEAAGHEIAVLGDKSWVGASAGRPRFAQELTRRFESARAAGLTVSTLALRDVEMSHHLDLLVKRQISMIRSRMGSRRITSNRRPSSLRYGLWQHPVDVELPLRTRWPSGQNMALRRAIRHAVEVGRTVHVGIDASRLVHSGTAGFQTLESLFRHTLDLRKNGSLRIQKLCQISAALVQPRPNKPAQSILRRAA